MWVPSRIRSSGNRGRCALLFIAVGVAAAVAITMASVRQGPDLFQKSVRRADASHWLPRPHYTFSTDNDLVAFVWINATQPGFMKLNLRQRRSPDRNASCHSGARYLSIQGV